jgi:hypothetical protein
VPWPGEGLCCRPVVMQHLAMQQRTTRRLHVEQAAWRKALLTSAGWTVHTGQQLWTGSHCMQHAHRDRVAVELGQYQHASSVLLLTQACCHT